MSQRCLQICSGTAYSFRSSVLVVPPSLISLLIIQSSIYPLHSFIFFWVKPPSPLNFPILYLSSSAALPSCSVCSPPKVCLGRSIPPSNQTTYFFVFFPCYFLYPVLIVSFNYFLAVTSVSEGDFICAPGTRTALGHL